LGQVCVAQLSKISSVPRIPIKDCFYTTGVLCSAAIFFKMCVKLLALWYICTR
jgi:hypothetical protein